MSSGSPKAAASGEVFRARMECQCREIARYRCAEMREAGRSLTMDEAAMEWIERFAADFDRRCRSVFE